MYFVQSGLNNGCDSPIRLKRLRAFPCKHIICSSMRMLTGHVCVIARTQQTPPPEPFPVDYNVFVVGTDKKVDPYLATVTINGATQQMEIDTGSALTLISQATFSKLWPDGNAPHLESTAVRLRTYSGEELEVVGRAVVRVRCGGAGD